MDNRLLESFYLFRGAASEDMSPVDALAEEQRLGSGETVFHEGDEADAMYLVAHGTIDILKSSDETVIATLGAGDEFGELPFFDPGRRSATARTRETSQIIRIPFRGLRDLLAKRPALALVVHRNGCSFLAKRLRQTTTDMSFARELNRRHL